MNAHPASVRLLVFAVAVLAVAPGTAQEYGVYLNCSGQVQAGGRSKSANLDLALRRNSSLALDPALRRLAGRRQDEAGDHAGVLFDGLSGTRHRTAPSTTTGLRGTLLVWGPGLRELQTVRISVDRQSAALDGDMRDVNDRSIGHLKMRCKPSDNDSAPEPKF